MSGQSGYVCPLPLYYRLGDETWNDVASRFLQAILTLDPNLASASIQGANAIMRIGLPTGMVLAASGWQISEAPLLLDHTRLLKEDLHQLKATTRDWGLRDACDFLIGEYMGWEGRKKAQETGSYRGKVNLLLRDNPTLAMFSAPGPGFDLGQMLAGGQTVLLDFRGDQQNPELLKFKMMWCLDYYLNLVKHRGAGLSHAPVGLLIDEISMYSTFDATTHGGKDLFANLIDSLLNIWSRQGMVYVTIANQEMFQISPRLFKTLMGCGSVVCGLTSDWDAAVYLAREFMPAQPHRVKRYEPIYRPDDTVRDYRQVDMSLEEQTQRAAALFKNLGKFQFLVKEVGNPRLWLLDITDLDPGVYPDEQRVAELRRMLSSRCGVPVEDILDEIENRQEGRLPASGKKGKKRRRKPGAGCDTLAGNGQTDRQDVPLPGTRTEEGEDDLDDLYVKAPTQDP
jgi:hypothetical protein